MNIAVTGKKEHNKHSNSDGLFSKDGKHYLWEAKHWAKWNEGKPPKQQVEDLLGNSPWLLAKNVRHQGKLKDIDGFLFSWWQRFEGHEKLRIEVSQTINLPFRFYFTSEIIDDCRTNKYQWYRDLVNEQKENINEFFSEILGEL